MLTDISTAELKIHQDALLQLLQEFDRVCRKLGIKYTLFAGTMLGAVRHQGFIPWDDDLDILMLRQDYDLFMQQAEQHLDTEKFFLQKEFSQHWPMFFSKLRLNNTTCLEKFHPKDKKMHQGIYIDIFPCDNLADNNLVRKCQFIASKIVIAKSLYKRGYETDSTKKKLFMLGCRLLPQKPFVAFVKGKNIKGAHVHTFFAAASKYHKNIFSRSSIENVEYTSFQGGQYLVSTDWHNILTVLYGNYMQLPPPQERAIKQHAILVDVHNSYEKYENYRDGMTFDVYTRSIR